MSHGGPLLALALAAFVGVAVMALAPRLKLPSIALLLLAGVLLGPEALGWVDPASLGSGLSLIVQIAVAVILFEGGLTLDVKGYRKAPKTIGRMLTVGVAVTWLGTALALHLVMDLGWSLALLGGSLVIVTGPTVVSPLLRRLGVRKKLYHVLYWEGVLIDAVGVFIAILCFEWVTQESATGPLYAFGLRVVVGMILGAVGGYLLDIILRADVIPAEQTNIFVLGGAVLVFAICETILPESGILAVIVAGLLLGIRKPPRLRKVKRFKLELTELSIGILFILLSARLELRSFLNMGMPLVILLSIVMFVLRPINIIISTWGQSFDVQEKLFLSWLAPRGIVAASMASLVSIELEQLGLAGAEVIETFVFAVIGATVVLQGLSAPLLVRWLGLREPPRTSWLLLGEYPVTFALGRALCQAGGQSIVVAPDVDEDRVNCPDGMTVIDADPLDPDLMEDPRFINIGNVLAIAQNPHVNRLVCQHWSPVVGPQHCYRWTDFPTALAAATNPAAGYAIWTDLDAPFELAHELELGTLVVEAVSRHSEHATEIDDEDRVLFAMEGHRAVPLSAARPASALPEDRLVMLRRVTPTLKHLLRAAIVLDPAPGTYGDAIRAILGRAAADGVPVDVEQQVRRVLAREEGFSTAMGHGIGLPHTYVEGLKASRCYVGAIPDGLAMETPDGEPMRLMFLVLSPPNDPEAHLRTLATLARLASAVSLAHELDDAKDEADLLRRLRSH